MKAPVNLPDNLNLAAQETVKAMMTAQLSNQRVAINYDWTRLNYFCVTIYNL